MLRRMGDHRWVVVGTLGIAACGGPAANEPDAVPMASATASGPAAVPEVAKVAPPTASAIASTSPSPVSADERRIEIDLDALQIDDAHETITYDVDHRGTRKEVHTLYHFDYASFMRVVGRPKRTGRIVVMGTLTYRSKDSRPGQFDCVVTALSEGP